MKLQQLRFLNAVVDHGLNITAAAEHLYTSQPGISKQIRLLEDELGMTLFVRRGKRLDALTPAGREVVTRAGRVLREVESIKGLADELRGQDQGQLSLATTQTQARYVLPSILSEFRQQHPATTVALHQGTSEQIARMLNDRTAEFAMATGAAKLFPGIVRLPVHRWNRVVVVPRTHPLAESDQALSLETLARLPLVTYLFSDRPDSSLMSAFATRGLTPSIAFTARDSDVIKACVRNGLGVGILAGMALEPGHDDDLIALPAQHLLPTLTTWIGWRQDQLLRSYHEAFLRLLMPDLPAALIDDAIRGRTVPELDELTQEHSLPLRNGQGNGHEGRA